MTQYGQINIYLDTKVMTYNIARTFIIYNDVHEQTENKQNNHEN